MSFVEVGDTHLLRCLRDDLDRIVFADFAFSQDCEVKAAVSSFQEMPNDVRAPELCREFVTRSSRLCHPHLCRPDLEAVTDVNVFL